MRRDVTPGRESSRPHRRGCVHGLLRRERMDRRIHREPDHHNTGAAAVNGWALTWSFPGDQKVTNAWNATVTQSGRAVTATNVSYDASIAPGSNVQFGFQGTFTSNDASPAAFALNGTPCGS